MKIGTYCGPTGGRLFVADGEHAIDLFAAAQNEAFRSVDAFIAGGRDAQADAAKIVQSPPDHAILNLADLEMDAPIRPSTVLCAGSNYHAHNAEKANAPLSGKEPEFFLKTSDCVIGPGQGIVYDAKLTQKLDCETELAIVIGKSGRHIPIEDALSHVFGYTVANDVTARDRQVRKTSNGTVFYELGRGKAFDSSLPMGPTITTADEIANPQDLSISTRINGELRQSANTSEMIWTCADLIHFFSINFTLKPGMVILTGTPAGTAWSTDAELGGTWQPTEGLTAATRYCLPGDDVVSEIEDLGVLSNPVVAAS